MGPEDSHAGPIEEGAQSDIQIVSQWAGQSQLLSWFGMLSTGTMVPDRNPSGNSPKKASSVTAAMAHSDCHIRVPSHYVSRGVVSVVMANGQP